MLSIEQFSRSDMARPDGLSYLEFSKTLAPHYTRVWCQIVAGFCALGCIILLCIIRDNGGDLSSLPLTVAIAAPLIGYTLHYLMLFFHEAAHFNIASDRKRNDRLADLVIGSLLGQSIKDYRAVHLLHHKYLGLPEDPERSYFEHLSWQMIVESLTGIRVLKVILARRKAMKLHAQHSDQPIKERRRSQVILAIALHSGIIAGSMLMNYWSLAVAWAMGIGVFFPFFASLRQLLEHRSEEALPSIDYTKVPHGQTHRMFGDGLFASTFGAAGFNRHLLHHWDMRISCTRLKEMESFLNQTPMVAMIQQSSIGYISAFSRLKGVSRAA